MIIKDLIRHLHISFLRFNSRLKSQVEPKGKVLIVAPHPDDEVIGCGGLIARLVEEGRTPQIIVMTGGDGSHNGCCQIAKELLVKARRELTRNALSILGVPENYLHELDFPDGGIDNTLPQIEQLKTLLSELKPDSIFVPHWGEGWSDHVRTAQIIRELAPTDVSIWEYCVWVWYYNVWRDIDWGNAAVLSLTSVEQELKHKAMDAYIIPLAPCGNPWSGVLPKMFIEANSGIKELYFKNR